MNLSQKANAKAKAKESKGKRRTRYLDIIWNGILVVATALVAIILTALALLVFTDVFDDYVISAASNSLADTVFEVDIEDTKDERNTSTQESIIQLTETTTTTTETTTTTTETTTTTTETTTTTTETTTTTTETTNNMYSGMTYLGNLKITGYVATGNPTASGCMPYVGGVALSKSYGISFGTTIYIEGLGYYTVNDTGCGYGVVDVFCNSTSECYALTTYANVYVVN